MSKVAKKNILGKFNNNNKIDPLYQDLKEEMVRFKKSIKIFAFITIVFLLVVFYLFFKINGIASFGAFLIYSFIFVLGTTFLFVIYSILRSRRLNGKIKSFQRNIPLVSIDDFSVMHSGGLIESQYDYVPMFRLVNKGWIVVLVPYNDPKKLEYKAICKEIESAGNLLHNK